MSKNIFHPFQRFTSALVFSDLGI